MADLETRTRALLASDRVTAPTRRALAHRLDQTFPVLALFSAEQKRTLQAVCLRLIPEPELVIRTALATAFEARLAEGFGRGWRYADARDDVALHRAGLDALDASARQRGGHCFADLDPDMQDTLLQAAADGDPLLSDASLEHGFEELLTGLTEIYYAHPLVQVSIGYDGMADAQGVKAIGLEAVAAEALRLEP